MRGFPKALPRKETAPAPGGGGGVREKGVGATKSMAPPASHATSSTRNKNSVEEGEGKEEKDEEEEEVEEVEGLEEERARMEVGLSLVVSFHKHHIELHAFMNFPLHFSPFLAACVLPYRSRRITEVATDARAKEAPPRSATPPLIPPSLPPSLPPSSHPGPEPCTSFSHDAPGSRGRDS